MNDILLNDLNQISGLLQTTKDYSANFLAGFNTLPAAVPQFLQAINGTGQVVMTPTVYNGTPGIRTALVNWRTTDKEVDLVWQEISQYLFSEEV